MKAALLVTLSLVAAAFSVPTENTDGYGDGCGDGYAKVKMCTDANERGECREFKLPFNGDKIAPVTKCVQLYKPLFKNVGSFIVAPGAYCRTTSVNNCANLGTGEAIIFPPGAEDFRNYQYKDIGDRTASFQCQKCTNCK